MLAMRSMARAGIGVAILPCYVGDKDPELRRIVGRPIVDGMMDLWVLFYPAIQRAARVRALSEFIAETDLADRDRIAVAALGADQSPISDSAGTFRSAYPRFVTASIPCAPSPP